MLGDLLKRLQMQGIDRLAHCRLHLSDSMCLVGVPDPTGQLKEGEVYLVLPKDRNDFRSVVFSPASFSIMGKVFSFQSNFL